MPELILASSSRYRAALLRRLGLPFAVQSPDIDEAALPDERAEALVQRLARAKAANVFAMRENDIIIASDQVGVVDGPGGERILGKPGDRQSAITQLKALSGREVRFLTSLCVCHPGGEQLGVDTTRVQFRKLEAHAAARYVDREKPLDCAGSFRSEGLGIALFERIEGNDPNALIGLPLIQLCEMLRRIGIDPLGEGQAA